MDGELPGGALRPEPLTNLRSPEQLDTVPVEIMAALSRLGPEAAWAGARLGLSGLSVGRVTLHVRLNGGEATS